LFFVLHIAVNLFLSHFYYLITQHKNNFKSSFSFTKLVHMRIPILFQQTKKLVWQPIRQLILALWFCLVLDC